MAINGHRVERKVTNHDLWLSDQEQGKYIGAHRGYINGRPGCPVATQNATLRGESAEVVTLKNYRGCAPKIIPVATSARWTGRPVNNWKYYLHWKSKDGDESMTRDQHVKLQHPWIKQEESELQVPHKRSCSALKSKGNLIWAPFLWLVGNVNKSFRLNYCDNVKSHSWIRMHRLHEVLKH